MFIVNALQKIDPGRRRRRDVRGNSTIDDHANNHNSGGGDGDGSGDADSSMMLVGRVHVYSPDDLLADNFNHTAGMDLVDPFQSFTSGN